MEGLPHPGRGRPAGSRPQHCRNALVDVQVAGTAKEDRAAGPHDSFDDLVHDALQGLGSAACVRQQPIPLGTHVCRVLEFLLDQQNAAVPADCHTPDLGPIKGLYSDLLLHRMGQQLEGGGFAQVENALGQLPVDPFSIEQRQSLDHFRNCDFP